MLLFLPGNNLEITWNFMSPEKWEPWKLHGISCDPRSGKPTQLWVLQKCAPLAHTQYILNTSSERHLKYKQPHFVCAPNEVCVYVVVSDT